VSRLLCLPRRSRRRPVAYKKTVVALVADRGSSGLSKPWCNRGQLPIKPISAPAGTFMHARHAQLFFVFFAFQRAHGQRAVRVFFACNRRASNGQRAIRAAFVCSTRASTRASVFDGAHAFSCGLYKILRKLQSEGPKYFARRGELFCFPNAE
jgi:hypothetical protein